MLVYEFVVDTVVKVSIVVLFIDAVFLAAFLRKLDNSARHDQTRNLFRPFEWLGRFLLCGLIWLFYKHRLNRVEGRQNQRFVFIVAHLRLFFVRIFCL